MATITHRQLVITFALIMGLFLAALEGTVISTAMPTIIAQLGGLEVYSWAFSSYMLASTTTIPIFGRLSDLYGRKPIYLGSIVLFLIGSALCGQAQNMTELIAFRAIQGLGAGGLLPVTFTIIGDLFTFEQRARMQGLFSSVWGVSSVIGPLCGGFLVDHVSWRWVFYLNIPFGLLAATIILLRFHEAVEDRAGGQVDYRGALLLATSVLCLLFAVLEGGRQYAWTDPRIVGLLVTAGLGCAAFIWLEQRIDEPLMPLSLFKDRLYLVATGYNFLAGFALMGIVSYIPLFVQGVLETSATRAGATLTPLSLAWVSGSIISGQLLLRVGPRQIVFAGAASLLTGTFVVTQLGIASTQLIAVIGMMFMGLGMGLTLTSFLVSVQNRNRRAQLGVATSGLQFINSIGGTIGVSVLGAVMASRLSDGLASLPGGKSVNPVSLLDSNNQTKLPPAVDEAFQELLAAALHPAFMIAFGVALVALIVVLFTPRGSSRALVEETKSPLESVTGR